MIEDVKKDLEQRLGEHAGTTALYLSGGSDSLLLLKILIDVGKHFNVVTFDYTFNKEQRQLIDTIAEDNNIRIFSYRPAAAYFIGDGKDKVAFVEEYAMLDGATMPFVRDAVHDESKCIYDVRYDGDFQTYAPIGFTLHLFGTRSYDHHWTMGKAWAAKEQQYKGATYYAPLWGWTREMVAGGLSEYNAKAPKPDTGNMPLCTLCMTAKDRVMCPKVKTVIEPHEWDPAGRWGMFRTRHGRV